MCDFSDADFNKSAKCVLILIIIFLGLLLVDWAVIIVVFQNEKFIVD